MLTFLPAAVVAAGLLLCFLLRYLKPEFLFFPSLVGYAFPVLLLLGFVFVILYLIFLRWKVLLFVVCIAINYPNIVALLRGKGSPEPPKMEWVSADRFKVLTYNVRLFNYYGEIPGEKQQIKEQLLDYVKDQDADVVCFQEYYESKNSSFTLGRKLPQAGYRHHTKPASNKNFHYGNIIYSKFPIIREGSLQGLSRFDVVFADLLVHQDTLRVYNIHLESNRFDKTDRAFFEHLRASSQNNGKDVDYTRGAQRMLGKVKKATLRRSDQVRRLIRHVQDSLAPSRV